MAISRPVGHEKTKPIQSQTKDSWFDIYDLLMRLRRLKFFNRKSKIENLKSKTTRNRSVEYETES